MNIIRENAENAKRIFFSLAVNKDLIIKKKKIKNPIFGFAFVFIFFS